MICDMCERKFDGQLAEPFGEDILCPKSIITCLQSGTLFAVYTYCDPYNLH